MNDYANRLMNQSLMQELIEKGSARLNEDGYLIFGKSKIKNLSIKNLDLDPNDGTVHVSLVQISRIKDSETREKF